MGISNFRNQKVVVQRAPATPGPIVGAIAECDSTVFGRRSYERTAPAANGPASASNTISRV
jgi:hypothetical protein